MHHLILAKIAGEIGVGPQISYIDPDLKALITHYIVGKEATPKNFQDLLLIDEMAGILQKLHQNGRLFPIATSPFE